MSVADIEIYSGEAAGNQQRSVGVRDVQSDINRTIDHLLNGRTTRDQRKGLSTATERAERVTAGSDAAVGRALK